METSETPINSTSNCCSDKKKCVLCGTVAVMVLFLASAITFFIGKQLNLKQISLCSPCPACERCEQAINQPSTDPTAGWKTYTNEKYGYSLKYPTDWQYKERELTIAAQEVWFGNKNLENIITFYVNKDKYLTEEKITCLQKGGKEIMVGENKGLIEYFPDGQNPAQDFVCFEKRGRSYEFQYVYSTSVDSKNLFNQILSTFKFLN